MSPKIAASFMRVIVIGSIIAALLFATGAMGDPTGMMNLFFASVIPGGEGMAAITAPEAKMGYAIAGGVFAGFMVMIFLITIPAIEAGNKAIMRATVYALLVWYVVDSGASIAGGAPINAFSNALFLVLYLLPLIWVRSESASQTA